MFKLVLEINFQGKPTVSSTFGGTTVAPEAPLMSLDLSLFVFVYKNLIGPHLTKVKTIKNIKNKIIFIFYKNEGGIIRG